MKNLHKFIINFNIHKLRLYNWAIELREGVTFFYDSIYPTSKEEEEEI